jgi:hypothetical protein
VIEVLVIVGLPGSGKTRLAMDLMDDQTTLIDDLDKDVSRIQQFNDHPTPRLIITDPHLCHASREAMERRIRGWFGECQIQTISFANDPRACWANIEGRADGRLISWPGLVALSKRYDPQQWEQSRPVWSTFNQEISDVL